MVRKARRTTEDARTETHRERGGLARLDADKRRREDQAASAAGPLLDDETIQAILDAIVPE